MASPHLTALTENGYVIIRDAIPAAQLSRLQAAAKKVTERARKGEWPWVRRCERMFPPWRVVEVGVEGEIPIWGVQHLLHPSLSEANEFAELYFGDVIMDVVKELFGFPKLPVTDLQNGVGSKDTKEPDEGEDVLVMELLNLLVDPPTPMSLRWHRDDIPFTLSPAEEATALGLSPTSTSQNSTQQPQKRRLYHTQYNLPLHPDTSLHLIPHSHLRPRTPRETALLTNDPSTSDPSLGWQAVSLNPGDIVFYDNDIIHRGVYEAGTERATVHGSVGDVRGGGARARNVLQHGVGEWIGKVERGCWGLDGGLRVRAEGMRGRLVEMGRGREGGVGFSLEG